MESVAEILVRLLTFYILVFILKMYGFCIPRRRFIYYIIYLFIFHTMSLSLVYTQDATFTYLNEVLVPKNRLLNEGLPYNSEGYERAKTILKSTFGKPNDLAKVHIQNILGSNPVYIHNFYQKLIISIQSLDTMGKLRGINGYIRTTVDKLPGIWVDLVRLDNNWQE